MRPDDFRASVRHSSEGFSEVLVTVVENQHSSTSAAPMPETRYVGLEDWVVGGRPRLRSDVARRLHINLLGYDRTRREKCPHGRRNCTPAQQICKDYFSLAPPGLQVLSRHKSLR
jgi:hypothetical protein